MTCIHEPNPNLPLPRTKTSIVSQNQNTNHFRTGPQPFYLSFPPSLQPHPHPLPPTPQPTSSLPLTPLQHRLGIPNPRILPLPHPLQRQRRNQRRPHPTPILRRQNFNRILPPRPAQNLPQRDSAARLEVRVLVEHGAVGADVAGFPALLLADGGDAAGGEAGGTRAD